ncbi:MAG: PD-(D/E)XK nuclease family protein [Candidatus Binatia bacterium]
MLIVGSSREACHAFARAATWAAGARVGLECLSSDVLATRLTAARLARRGLVAARPLAVEAVVARVIHECHAAGRLGRLAPLVGRPGLARAVARTLGELRLNDVAPAAVRGAGHAGGDLAELALAFERELRADGLADPALVLAEATAAVTGAAAPSGAPLLLLDVAIRSAAEARFVEALVRAAPAVLAVAGAGDVRTIAHLERVLDCAAEYLSDVAPGSLGVLQAHLFEEPSPPATPLDDTVALASWPGEARECVEIVRAIVAEGAAGTPFERMAVLLHAPERYAAHLEEACARAEVPALFARGTARPHAAGRAILALLACAGERLSARRFAEYLSLAQVPAAERSARAPWRWERLLVDAAVIGGRDRWQRRLAGLAAELRAQRTALAPEDEAAALRLDRLLGDLAELEAVALPIIDRLAALPERASWGEWLGHLRALAAATLRDPATVMETLDELAPMGPVGPVELDEVQLVLAPRLRELAAPPPERAEGAVLVAPTALAHGLVADVVFVPGLAEKLFPRRIVEDPLLPDAARGSLDAPWLLTQPARVDAERFALRLAVGAARRRVVLSWPRVDVEVGRARVPSFYALEVLRAAEGRLPGFEALAARVAGRTGRLGWPAPEDPAAAIDEAECDLAVLAPLMGADVETAAGSARYLLSANPHLGRALRARARRWIRRWTTSDGLVDPDAPAHAALARHQLAMRPFSPTALQHFAACPYRFFLQAIHRLAPREEADALESLDPLTRGALVHDAQFATLTALRDGGLLPVRTPTLDAALAVLDEAVTQTAARWHDDLAPAIERVWEDAVALVRADLREWLRRMAAAPGDWVPWRFELSFGIADRARTFADPASVPDAVPVTAMLRLRGAIDLVERNPRGVLRVTDHKTGQVRVKDGFVVAGGDALQPVLYALASERLLGAPVESGRLWYCTADGRYAERVVPLDATSRAAADEVVAILDRALCSGFLPAAPRKDACRYCDYRPVCGPLEEQRVARKPRARLADLERLRSLP